MRERQTSPPDRRLPSDAGALVRGRADLAGGPGGFTGDVCDRALDTQPATLQSGGVPRVGPESPPRRGEEHRVDAYLHRICGIVLAARRCGPEEERRAPAVAVHGGDRGETTQAVTREWERTEVAAPSEGVAVRDARGVRVTVDESDEPGVAADEHLRERVVDFAGCDARRVHEVRGVLVGAQAHRTVRGCGAEGR